jgi:hypothetical protein
MARIYLNLGEAVIAIECPEVLLGVVKTFWPRIMVDEAPECFTAQIIIEEAGPNSWRIVGDGLVPIGPVEKADLVTSLAECIQCSLGASNKAISVNAGAVAWEQDLVWVLGSKGAGKTLLISWLVERGLALIADNNLAFLPQENTFVGLGGPIAVQSKSGPKTIGQLEEFKTCLNLAGSKKDVILANPEWVLPNGDKRPSFLVFVDHKSGSELSVAPMTAQDILAKIKNMHPNLDSDELSKLQAYLSGIPAFALSYSSYADIENVVDQLCFYALSVQPEPDVFHEYVQKMSGANAATKKKVHEVPAPTNRNLSPRMTIGMATYDDYDGVYFSIQAIRLYHPEVLDDVEFLVLDNNPEGACSAALKKLENSIPNYRYIPATGIKGTAVRDYIFQEAFGDYVLSMDCHVFFAPGSLKRLLKYYDENPDTSDLLQGPLLHDDLASVSTHFEPKWSGGMFGKWSPNITDYDKDAAPLEIPSQGLGVFSCRKAAWPGFNPGFQGFGGEEGYIHQKFRNAGHKALCLPFLQWMHRFERPFGVAYRNIWEDRIKNYILGWEEVGLPIDEMRAHFVELVNKKLVDNVFREVENEKSKPIIGQSNFPNQRQS